MMKRDWDLLFSEYDLRTVLEGQLQSVGNKVLAIGERRFQAETDEVLAAALASELVVSPLELLEEKISVSQADAKIDVRNEPDRYISDRSQPFYLNGIKVTYHVPFAGDPNLLKCRPNTFTSNPPRAVVGPGKELRFPYDCANRDVVSTKPIFEKDSAALRQWLPWVNQQVSLYNALLETAVRSSVAQRRVQLAKAQSDLSSLGYEVRATAPAPPVPASRQELASKRQSRRKVKRREYDVALSFAGENREYVEQVAETLVTLDVAVFYDDYEQVNLWGKDLAAHLGQVYSNDSHFVVLFASRHYAAKAWPSHEKQFALSRHLSGDTGRILPVRFDDTEIPGIPTTIGYLDARVLTPAKLAELIRQKVDAGIGDA